MSLLDAKQMERVMDRVEEKDREFRRGLREQFKGIPAGKVAVTDEQIAALVQEQAEKWGWAVMVDEDGRESYGNVYLRALELTEEGRADLRRYQRVFGGGLE